MKRVFLCTLLLSILLLASCSEKERYEYSDNDRVLDPLYMNASTMRVAPLGTSTNASMADLIAQVEIRSEQTIEERTLEGGMPYTVSHYNAHIEEIWYGDPVDYNIQIWFVGDQQVLHQNDQLILYATYGDMENYYVPVDGPYSIFIINPPTDTLFPLSLINEYEELENQDVSVLREETEAVLANIASGNSPVAETFLGEASADYIAEHSESPAE